MGTPLPGGLGDTTPQRYGHPHLGTDIPISCKLLFGKLAPLFEEPFSLQEVTPLEPITWFPAWPQANYAWSCPNSRCHSLLSYAVLMDEERSLRQGLTLFQQCRERKERKAEPHLGACKNKATNQASWNLKFFPSWSFLEQMHKRGIESRYLGFYSFPALTNPALGSSVPMAHLHRATSLSLHPSVKMKAFRQIRQVTRTSLPLISTAKEEGGSSNTKQPFHLFFSSPQNCWNLVSN